jgi:hypothetical protein
LTCLAWTARASKLALLIRNSDSERGSDFDFGLLSAEFQLQACRDKTLVKTYAKLHRAHVDTMAGLLTKLFAKLDRIPLCAERPCRNYPGVDHGPLSAKNECAGIFAKRFRYGGDSPVLGLDLQER